MRQLLSARLWIAFGILAVLGAGLLIVFSLTTGESSPVVGVPDTHRIDLIASVSNLQADEGWSIATGVDTTVGQASPILDDGRMMRIASDTSGEITCTDFVTPSACVLLADTLGGAIVWFALVPADSQRPLTHLNLPAVVDMLDGGNLGVLTNGWVIKLSAPTKRTCDTETKTLREFITQFSPNNSMSILDIIADEITEVVCKK
ncbi:MAG: hypothetical protein ACYC06_09180 [Ilumatobacteraceae bacterium]